MLSRGICRLCRRLSSCGSRLCDPGRTGSVEAAEWRSRGASVRARREAEPQRPCGPGPAAQVSRGAGRGERGRGGAGPANRLALGPCELRAAGLLGSAPGPFCKRFVSCYGLSGLCSSVSPTGVLSLLPAICARRLWVFQQGRNVRLERKEP